MNRVFVVLFILGFVTVSANVSFHGHHRADEVLTTQVSTIEVTQKPTNASGTDLNFVSPIQKGQVIGQNQGLGESLVNPPVVFGQKIDAPVLVHPVKAQPRLSFRSEHPFVSRVGFRADSDIRPHPDGHSGFPQMSRPPMQQFSNSIQEIPHPMQQVSPRHRAMRRPMTRTECISTREPCLTDSECTQGQTCRSGRRSNKCVCHCSNFKKCSSDADCSGLIGACVFEPPTFPFFDPRVCHERNCHSSSDCFGMECEPGFCSCF